jgi:hypothetical protein
MPVEHRVLGVVERLHVRIHFFPKRAGTLAQPLARFDNRPGEHNVGSALLQDFFDGVGHGEKRLTRTRRTQKKRNRVLLEQFPGFGLVVCPPLNSERRRDVLLRKLVLLALRGS